MIGAPEFSGRRWRTRRLEPGGGGGGELAGSNGADGSIGGAEEWRHTGLVRRNGATLLPAYKRLASKIDRTLMRLGDKWQAEPWDGSG